MRVGRVAWQIGSVGGLVGFGLVLGFCFRDFCWWVGLRGYGSCWSFHLLDSSFWSGSALLVMGLGSILDFPWSPALRAWVFLWRALG